MRRKAPALPISPKQLKHFAVATVVLTGLLALVATGQDAGVAAQVSATQAKNDMVAKEQQKLGTKKVASNLKVRNQGGGFSNDGGEGGGGGAGGAGGGGFGDAASAGPSTQRAVLPPGAVQVGPDGKLKRKPNVRPYEGTMPKEGDGTASHPAVGISGSAMPSVGPLDAAAAASRQRSGSGDSGGD